MKNAFRSLAVVAVFLLASRLDAAPTQGRVAGKVTDLSGNPIEGVTVTITTPALSTLKLSVKTDKAGRYGLIVNDATMRYHMTFEKEGYATAQRDEKFSTVDQSLVDQQLAKGSAAPAPPPGAPGAPAAPAAPKATSVNDAAAKSYNDAVDLMNAGDKDGAAVKFADAVAKNPDLPQGWFALASIAFEKKDWAKTIEYGQKATDLDPTQSNLYGMMAEAASKSGDKKAAAEFRKKYDDANPDSPEILYNKGIEAYNKKKSKEAEDFLTKAVAAKPEFALAHYYLALAAMNNKHNPVAREHFQKYLELDPNGSEAATAKELLPLVK